MLFPEIVGTPNHKFDDDDIGLRFKCNPKERGEQPTGKLAQVLNKFNLSVNIRSFELKEKIWSFLEIQEKPINLTPNERTTVLNMKLWNSFDITILRNKEGRLLLSKLNLPESTTKEDLQNVLISKILNDNKKSEAINMSENEITFDNNNDEKYDEYVKQGKIEFITFHPSYSYEDFVEGIRPILKEGQNVQFKIHDGIFKDICFRAIQSLVNEVIKLNPDSGLSELTSWSDFDSSLDLIKKALKKTPTSTLPGSINHVLIIDEINRGDISKIFGELITLIESDKRLGEKNMIAVRLPYTKERFCIPPNLYIVGTMNTADRSIALVDVALRRRFNFEEMKPRLEALKHNPDKYGSGKVKNNDLFIKSVDAVIKLNNLLGLNEDIGRDKKIGHAFFCNINIPDQIISVWKNKIMPLLEEYYFFDKSDLQKLSNEIYTTKDGWDFNRVEDFIEHINGLSEV